MSRRLRILGAVAVVAGLLGFSTAPASGVAGFGDVGADRYFTDAVQWMVDEDITTGTSATCFSPDDTVTRGQVAAFLWRMEGEPAAPPHPFTDVVAEWQQGAVSWMFANDITTGTSASAFSPELPVTRAQVATFLFRYRGEPDTEIDPTHPTSLWCSQQVVGPVTGYDSLFIGHSFFAPIARQMDGHALAAGFEDHTQTVVFSGGASGTPEALWNNATKRAEIQAVLDGGDIELFGMTYHPTYPSLEGYRNWVDYALAQNPDTMFFVAFPWLTDPGSMDAATYDAIWHAAHEALSHEIIDGLRAEFPGVVFYDIPYGQAAAELYLLFEAGALPDVDALVTGPGRAGIFRDSFGHADAILLDLAELVWLRAIYGVPISSYDDPGYQVDLRPIADAIMDAHDPAYNAP